MIQLKLDSYTGRRTFVELSRFERVSRLCLGADEFLAEVINGVQHADQTLQYNR